MDFLKNLLKTINLHIQIKKKLHLFVKLSPERELDIYEVSTTKISLHSFEFFVFFT